jgi:predicted DNA-binding transcriptional regulator AlpA
MQNLEAKTWATIPPNLDFFDSEAYRKFKLLRIDEVSELSTLGKSTINLWVAQGKFPKPIHLSSTLKVWRLIDIACWIDAATKGEANV